MKVFKKTIILLTLLSLAFSWTSFFEKLEQLKDKKNEIQESLNLESLGLSNLKNLTFKDLINFKLPDLSLSSKAEKLKHIIPKDLDPSHHKDIDEFWTGFFESFKLAKPTELIDCFGTMSGQVFFRKIKTINDLLRHSKENKNFRLHTDFAQFEVLMHALEHAHQCMFRSQDFERLTGKLRIPNDPEVIKRSKYLYYSAKYADLADDYNQIVESLDRKEFNQAGRQFADLFGQAIKDFKKQGEDVLRYQAFGNGLSGALGVSLPKESVQCYDSKSAKLLMDFFKGITEAVTEGKWYHAEDSVRNYWEKEGEKLLNKIPSKVWKCDMKSPDSREISEKLGIQLGSEEFMNKFFDYVRDHNIMYYSYIRSMRAALDKHDYLHAGAIYAHLLEAVAKST